MPTYKFVVTDARTRRRGKYAQARVAAGVKYADLQKLGFSPVTISNADKGKLPSCRYKRAAYLKAIGAAS